MTRSRGNVQNHHAPQSHYNGANNGIPGHYDHRLPANAHIPVQQPSFPLHLTNDFDHGPFRTGMVTTPAYTSPGLGSSTQDLPSGHHPLSAPNGSTYRGSATRGHLNPNFFPPSYSQPVVHSARRNFNGYGHQCGRDPSLPQQPIQVSYQGDPRPSQQMRSMQRDDRSFRGNGVSFQSRRGRGKNLRNTDSFEQGGGGATRGRAAPAVPSFGESIHFDATALSTQDLPRKPNLKKRKHNQLGLTPRTEQYESSDDQGDDENEESRLAHSGPGDRTSLQISYKGQTSTLLSASDIAAWIEERKKRWPTKARAAEASERRKGQHKEAQEAFAKARKERKDRQDAILEQKRQSKMKKRELSRKTKTGQDRSEDETAKSKRKIAKLQQKLEKEQQRVAKAEAKMLSSISEPKETDAAGRRQHRIEPLSNVDMIGGQDRTSCNDSSDSIATKKDDPSLTNQTEKEESSNVAGVLTPISEGNGDQDVPASDPVRSSAVHELQNDKYQMKEATSNVQTPIDAKRSDDDLSDSSSVLSSTDSEDMTSSSGSSDTDDDDYVAPDVVSSKDHRPERVPPPSRVKSSRICKNYLKGGRCRFGDRCTFKHELPSRGNRGARAKNEARPEIKKVRVSLYQRVSRSL